jgi:hypothetical protein
MPKNGSSTTGIHGAAALPDDAGVRFADHPGQHQLPGPAADAAASRPAFGEAVRRRLRRAVPERIALVGTGGISHWPATPDSGKINEPWDREFLDRWARQDKAALLSYSDEATYRDAGQGASRSAPSSPPPPPRAAGASCASTHPSRSSLWAAPWR